MKLFAAKKNPPKLSRAEALACIPQHMPTVTSTEVQGQTRLEYPLSMRPFFLQVAKKFMKHQQTPLTKQIELDEYGAMVWRLIDGHRTTSKIIEIFAADTGLSLQDAEISVTSFLRELGRRGLIGLNPGNVSGS